MTSFDLQAFAHHAQAIDERAELHRRVLDLVVRADLSTNFTLWSVPTALSLMSSASYWPLPISFTRANMPGVKRRSVFCEQAARVDRAGVRVELVVEEHHVALVRMTLFIGEARPTPGCGALRELLRSPRSSMPTYLRYTCSSPSKDT